MKADTNNPISIDTPKAPEPELLKGYLKHLVQGQFKAGFEILLELKKPLILILLSLVIGCGPDPIKSEPSCGFVTNEDHQRTSWNQRLPVFLFLHESFPEKAKGSLRKAIQIWEESMGRKLFVVQEEIITGPIEPAEDGQSVIYWTKNWESGKDPEQARTDLHTRGFEILEADLQINASAGEESFYFDNPTSPEQISLTSLLVHELGHVLGLAHNDSPYSVMKKQLAPHEERNHIYNEDLAHLHCEY